MFTMYDTICQVWVSIYFFGYNEAHQPRRRGLKT
jgi:hypothetical protein